MSTYTMEQSVPYERDPNFSMGSQNPHSRSLVCPPELRAKTDQEARWLIMSAHACEGTYLVFKIITVIRECVVVMLPVAL